MCLILNIDTALETASVCLARDGIVLDISVNENPKDHAAWLHPAIVGLLQKTGHGMHDLKAVAVSIGPGSYTGLRVGLSAAKGFCFAQQIPLITIGTLEMMAFSAKDKDVDLLCPLIDARRNEVFTAVYDKNLQLVLPVQSMIIGKNSFESLLSSSRIFFFGNGAHKLNAVLLHKNALFPHQSSEQVPDGTQMCGNASHLAPLSYKVFLQKAFSHLVYTEPLYIKEFYSPFRNASV